MAPQACQACHPGQFEGWAQSRHAHAMGAGVIGQVLDMDGQERQGCLHCHAPLAEQEESLDKGFREEQSPDDPTHSYPQGVTCSVCHLRQYRWYGPERRAGLPALTLGQAIPHGGWIAHEAFSDALFCAACHQFPAQGNAVNGKLLENTYFEWKASPQAREGKSCQTCHMPDRRHLFLGIHDPSMVSAGVAIETSGPTQDDEVISAHLALTNSGVGHLLPTYATPRLILAAYQTGADGEMAAGSLRQEVIGWSLSLDLAQEYSDTRLVPQQTAVLHYRAPVDPAATELVFQVQVEPEAFYTRFYQALLKQGLTGTGSVLIRQALETSLTTRYLLFQTSRTW